jgi:hypothetical protein
MINESVFGIFQELQGFVKTTSQTRLQFDFDNKEEIQQKSVAAPPPSAPQQPSTSEQNIISAPISIAAVVKSNQIIQPPSLKVTAVPAPPHQNQQM